MAQFNYLINLTNHPSSKWDKKQREEALTYVGDEIIDIPFPNIDPHWMPRDVERVAEELFIYIWNNYNCNGKRCVVHLMGEASFILAFYRLALDYEDMKIVVSTTERNCVEKEDGSRTYVFNFTRFRYCETRGHFHSCLIELNLDDRQKDMWRLKRAGIKPEKSPYRY